MPTVLIGGGSGLVGTRLSNLLTERGYTVIHLSRQANQDARFPTFEWDIENQVIDLEAIRQADYVINLAGAGIADRPWTELRKQLITNSRVDTTRLLIKGLKEAQHRPKAFLSSAAIGFYGNRGDELVDENSTAGAGFLTESCLEWESAIAEVNTIGIRSVAIRIGIVLSTRGGALEKMLIPVKWGVSGYFGGGKQWYSWIHIDDLCALFIHFMEHEETHGTYNGVAPNPSRNKAFAQAIMRAHPKRQLVLPVPAFLLRAVMGEMADTVLYSTKVNSAKTEASGFVFKYPELPDALAHLLTPIK